MLLSVSAAVVQACAVGGMMDPDAGTSDDADVSMDTGSMMPMDGGTADSGGDAGVGNDAGADAASEDSSIADGGPIDMGAVVCDPIDSSAVGMWVFDHANITDATARTALFDFSELHNVHTLYADVNGLIAEAVRAPADLVAFVSEAHARCISVEFLFSDARFIYPDDSVPGTVDRSDLFANIDAVVAFAEANPAAAPNGIHLYLRPYELDAEWSSDSAAISSQFLDVIAETQTRGDPFPLNVDIPFWYHTVQVARGDVSQGLDRWIIDLVPTVTIMAFYDDPSYVVTYAATALGYVSSSGKQAIVAVDVQCLDPAPRVSFWEEGTDTLRNALDYVHSAEASESGFVGMAVRDYEHYRVLHTTGTAVPGCPDV